MLERSWQRIRLLSDHPLYPFILAGLVFLDTFVFIIPSDGLLISSVFFSPKRWILMSLAVVLGSLLGSLILAVAVQHYGPMLIHQWAPGLMNSEVWLKAEVFFNNWGLGAIFLTGLLPMMQQPTVALAALAKVPVAKIFLLLGLGRMIKYLILAWVASHSPRLLNKFWGLKGELDSFKAPLSKD